MELQHAIYLTVQDLTGQQQRFSDVVRAVYAGEADFSMFVVRCVNHESSIDLSDLPLISPSPLSSGSTDAGADRDKGVEE